MHFTTVLLTTLAALAITTSATIAIGKLDRCDGTTFNLAWLKGQNPCDHAAFLSVEPDNFCERVFTTGGYSGLQVAGCGGPLWLVEDGDFSSNCKGAQNFNRVCNGAEWSGNLKKVWECTP